MNALGPPDADADLNPGIVRTVAWLRENGFDTCDSGDGKTHDFDCDRPYPYVVIRVAPLQVVPETDRLRKLLLEKGIEVQMMDEKNSLPNIQATYDACWTEAFIDVSNVDDAMLGL